MTQLAGVLDPFQYPQAWDTIRIGQTTSPGICKLSGFSRASEWDLKKGKGALGATLTFVGRPPAKGKVTFSLWTSTHFEEWRVFRNLLKYDSTKKAIQAVDIYHPSLADIDLKSVVVEEIGAIEHQGQGLYTVTVDFIEYFPPPKKSATSTPTGSSSIANSGTSGAKTSGTTDDPIADAQQKEIAALLVEAGKP